MDENKIIIAICGESYCTACTEDLKHGGRRAHFSQILEDQFGYRVLHFAHGGFGNTGIFFQIQESLKHQPQVVVYNKTWPGRLAIKVNKTSMFEKQNGLKNFVFSNKQMPSTYQAWAGDMKSPILNTVVQGLEHHPLISPEKFKAVQMYMTEVFDYDLQMTLDQWLFDYWHQRIQATGALALCFNDANVGQIAYDFSQANRDFDSPFHTDRATQERIAQNINKIIVDKLPQLT